MGDRIACVPRSSVFSAEAVLSRRNGSGIVFEALEIFEANSLTRQILDIQAIGNTKYELMRLALLLHLERRCLRQEHFSPWDGYIHGLPNSTPNSLFLDAGQIDQFMCGGGCNEVRAEFYRTIDQDQRFFAAMTSSLLDDLHNNGFVSSDVCSQGEFEASLRWAYSTMQSRAHFFEVWNVAGPVPLIDMANHDSLGGANAALDVPQEPTSTAQRAERNAWHREAGAVGEEAEAEMVMLIATCDIEAGQEVLIDYGCDNNEGLLRSYGFVDPRYPSHPGPSQAERTTILSTPYTVD